MAASVYAGFALCSDSTGPVATATFDHALAASGPAFYLSDAQPAARNAVQSGATATYAVSVVPVNAFTGVVTLGASGLPSQVAAAFSSPTVAGSGGSLLTLTTSGAAVGSYPITITGTSGSAVSRSVASLVVVTSPVGTLPDPWTDQAVGGSGGTATSFSGGVYTVTGPGLGFDASLDSFQFSSQPLVGDAAFTARITGVQNAITSSRYGIMLRDGLTPDAPFAALTLSRTAGGDRLDFLGRTSTGATPVLESGAIVTFPYWLRLIRSGSAISAYASADGVNFAQIGTTRTITMNTLVSAGLAVASHDTTTQTAATFDNVLLGANNDFSLIRATPARSIPAAAAVYFHSVKAIATGSAMGTVTLSVGNLPAGIAATFSTLTLSAGTVSNLRLDVAATVAPGTYTINISGAGGSVTHIVPLTYTVTASGTALPLPWAADDVGAITLPGSSTVTSSGATVQASGQTLGGTLDSFRYTYQPLTGDGTMIARMYTWDLRWDTSRLGVMIRDSLMPDGAHAFVRLHADVLLGQLLGDYPGFQYRSAPGANTTEAEVAPVGAVPYWFQLTRAGNLFTASGSRDGLTWIQLGAPVTIVMPSTVFIGYAVSSGNANGLSTVSFDSTLVALAPDFYLQTTPVSQTVPIGRGVAYSSVLLNSLVGFSSNVTLSAPSLPPGFTAAFTPATLSNGASVVQVVSDSTVPGGTYPITIRGVSGVLSHNTTFNVTVNPAQTTLPAPWLYDYIGTNPLSAQPSSATLVSGVFTLSGTACCLGGTSDTAFFAHQPLSGDGAIAGRLVNSVGNAGMMFRNTLDPASPFAAITLSRGVLQIDTRSTAGGASTTAVSLASVDSSASWVKVIRQGSQLTVFGSLDGVQWYLVPVPVSVSLSSNTEAGLFATGGATFDNVSIVTSPQLLVSAIPGSIYSMNGVGGTVQFAVFPGTGTITTEPVYSIAGLPSGVTATFGDSGITDSIPRSQGVKTKGLTLTASAGVAQGTYPLTITATSGSVSGSSTINLIVNPGFNISGLRRGYFNTSLAATPIGFYGDLSLPSGLSYSYSFLFDVTYIGNYGGTVSAFLGDEFGSRASFPASVTGTQTGIVAGTASTYTDGFRRLELGASAGSISMTQVIPLLIGPDYALCGYAPFQLVGCLPVTAAAGATAPVKTMTLTRAEGFSDAVTVSMSGLPAGIAGSFSPNVLSGGAGDTTTLTMMVDPSIAAGTYNGFIVETSNSINHTLPLSVNVATFGFSTTQPAAAITAGSQSTITGTLSYGATAYPGTVTFGNGILPTGVTVTFSPTSRSTAGNTTITIKTSATTPAGTYTLNFIGTSGALVESAPPVTLVVTSDFSLSASSMASVNAASNATSTITVSALGGFSGNVDLTVSGLPAGTTAAFNPTPVASAGTSILTVTTTAATPGGSYTLTITGTSGTFVHTKTVTLAVKNFTLSASPVSISTAAGGSATSAVTLTMTGGYNSTVTFGSTGLPSGATASFSPATANASGNTTVTVTTTGSVAPGTYNVSATGHNGSLTQSTPMTLVVSDGFSLSNSGTVTATAAGTNATATITLTATAGLTGATTLAIGGLPTNATASFNPTSITGSGTSTLTFVVPATTAGGTFPITVTGTNGSLTRTTTFNLTVKNFTLSAAPTSITATHGGAGVTSTITLTMHGGYSSSVAFSSSGQPTGVTVAFNPTSRTSTGTTIMTVTAGSAAAPGTYTLTVKGTNGSLVQNTPVTLTVN